MGQQSEGTERAYIYKTIEEIKEILHEYANDPYPASASKFDQLAASLIWSINWRQGDTVTAMGALLDIVRDQATEILELEKRIDALEKGKKR